MSENARKRVLYAEPDKFGNIKYWYAETLWKAAETAEVVKVDVQSLAILDEVVWFGGPKNVQPTIRKIAERIKDIYEADITFPIIKLKNGDIIDGAHRVARAYIEGMVYLQAVLLDDYPPHDGVVQAGEAAPQRCNI